MQRRLCSAILVLQAVVVGLSSLVLLNVEDVSAGAALGLGLGLAAGCLIVPGLFRFPWGYGLGWALQAGTLALGLLSSAMFVLGGIFLALWWTAIWLGRLIDSDKAAAARVEP